MNLGLHVLRRRPDGYHDLETAFVPLRWSDTLGGAPHDALALTCSDAALATDGSNLVVKAALALAAWAGVEPRAALHLDKRVPYGAGLGGGSSDAAAALLLLSEFWGLTVPPDALHALAATLGADVPFFLGGRPALATGRGDTLTPLLDASGAPYRCPFWLCVAVPPVHVPTAEAYGLVRPNDRDRPDLAAAVRSNSLARWRREVTNDFEGPISSRHPEIAAVKAALVAAGAGWAAMSGSGSAVVGAFDDGAAARAAAHELAPLGRVWLEAPDAGDTVAGDTVAGAPGA